MSGGPSNIQTAYTPANSALADQTYTGLSQGVASGANTAASNVGNFQSLIGQLLSNPYASGAQSGANQVASLGQGVGANQLGASSSLFGAAGGGLPYAQSELVQANDPQNALYNQQYQQLMDQQNATNAMNGVAGSPYAALTSGQAGQTFNNNWLNNQLGRQQTALSGYDSALGAAGTADTQASALGNQGLQTLTASSQLPSQTYNTNISNELQGLTSGVSGEGSALTPSLSDMQSLLSYLQTGQSATSVNNQAQQQAYNEESGLFGGLANLLGIGSGNNQTSIGSMLGFL
jgi:hypothetical protein